MLLNVTYLTRNFKYADWSVLTRFLAVLTGLSSFIVTYQQSSIIDNSIILLTHALNSMYLVNT
jgi:hypothetical protein